MLNSIILALSVSLDSLGIGITYGIKKARINFLAKCILFVMSISFAFSSLYIGDLISSFFSETLTNIISSIILIFIGAFVFFDPIPFDFDHSHGIDIKEAIALRNHSFTRFCMHWNWK